MRVSASRVAIVGGLLAAVYFAALFTVRRVPDRVLGLVGGPQGVAREGGLLLRYRPADPYDAAELTGRAAGRGVELRSESGTLVVGVPGVDLAEAGPVSTILAHGGLELREVVSGSALADYRRAMPPGVSIYIDQWDGVGTLASRTQAFLDGSDLARLIVAFEQARAAGWTQPPGSTIRYGRTSHGGYRSYVLRDEVLLDGSAIAQVRRSGSTLAIDVDAARRARLAARSARLIDHKIAVVVDGDVIAESIIRSGIQDGRILVTIDRGDPGRSERAAAVVAAALQATGLPAHGTVESSDWISPPALASFLLRARLLLGALGGLLTGLVIWLVVRIARPAWQPRTLAPGEPFPWRRVAVTLVAPAVLLVLGRVAVFGIEPELGDPDGSRSLGLLELGLAPIVVAHVMAELALLASPYRRRRRFDPATRVAIRRRIAIAALILALIESHLFAVYTGERVTSYLALVASLTGGMYVLKLLARLVDRHGLGTGYGVVIVSGWAIALARQLAGAPDAGHGLGVVTLAVIACVTIATLRMRIRHDGGGSLRVPSSSLDPVLLVVAVLALWPIAHRNLFAAVDGYAVAISAVNAVGAGWYLVVSLAALVPVWSFVLLRPVRAGSLAARAELVQRRGESARRAQFYRATLISLAMLALVLAASLTANAAGIAAPTLGDAVVTMLACAVLLDVADDLRVRRGDLVAVWPLYNAQHAELVRGLLHDVGIACHLRSSHLRTLLAALGSFAPIEVLVPRAAAEQARDRIAPLFGDPAAGPS